MSNLVKNPATGDMVQAALYASAAQLPPNGYPGSLAITLNDSQVYVLDATAGWVKTGTPASGNVTLNNVTLTGFLESGHYHIEPSEANAGSSGATKTIDLGNASAQKLTMTASCTLTLTNPQIGGAYVLRLVQGGAGSYTMTWPGSLKWPGGTAPTLSTTVGKVDLINLYWDGTSYYGSFALGY